MKKILRIVRNSQELLPTDIIILIDKPEGVTSFDVIRQIKKKFSVKKIGHSGTLDKFAAGLLIIAVGKTTRLLNYLLHDDKSYYAEVKLGVTTDTLDRDGVITESGDISSISEDNIKEALKSFVGEYDQLPPEYSALKINGVRSSDMVRKGLSPELKSRMVIIHNIEFVNYEKSSGLLMIKVYCSKGTYIRALARDIGFKLNTVAYIYALKRLSIGSFNIQDSIRLDDLLTYNFDECSQKFPGFIKNPFQIVSDFKKVFLNDNILFKVKNGVVFSRNDISSIEGTEENGRFAILDSKKNLIAIADMNFENWNVSYLNVFNI